MHYHDRSGKCHGQCHAKSDINFCGHLCPYHHRRCPGHSCDNDSWAERHLTFSAYAGQRVCLYVYNPTGTKGNVSKKDQIRQRLKYDPFWTVMPKR